MSSIAQTSESDHTRQLLIFGAVLLLLGAALISAGAVSTLADMPNACPVDGCEVKIERVTRSGEELEITFIANFTPDVSKNHFHVWWGENFTVQQVGRNAEPVYKVKQGRWHRHDDYPTYITQGAASTKVRGKATTICVSAADRHHNILDVKKYHCVDASQHL
ncbi:MAG: hypothetical protein QNJ61_08480 [Desulfobacterales bacterium]|nr:hypothetical protein [Desulfobacterales bacterium]